MNIDSRVITIGLFLVVQAIGAVIFGAKLSSEVERIAGIQGTAIPALQTDAQACQVEIHNLKKLVADQEKIAETIKGLDVLRFQVTQISEELERIRETNKDISSQHGRLFEILRNQGSAGPVQQSSKGYSYD